MQRHGNVRGRLIPLVRVLGRHPQDDRVQFPRQARPDLKLGICGEHGCDPDSIAFFARAGLDYVSCSPYRVPIARVAAAQAALSV